MLSFYGRMVITNEEYYIMSTIAVLGFLIIAIQVSFMLVVIGAVFWILWEFKGIIFKALFVGFAVILSLIALIAALGA